MQYCNIKTLILQSMLIGIYLIAPSAAISENAICTNYERFTIGNLDRLSKFMGKSYDRTYMNENVIAAKSVRQAGIYIAPPISPETIFCIENLEIDTSEVLKVISNINDRLGRANQLYPAGPRSKLLSSGEEIYLDGISVQVTVSNAPEPLRSIIAMTSVLGIDDTSCVRSVECIQLLEAP